MHHLCGANVINVCLASGQNIWSKVEPGTLNGAGVQVEASESAVQPGPGLQRHLSPLQIYVEKGLDAQQCTHTG